MKEPKPHEGHRNRMRERILRDGLENLAPHEVLEYFLYAFTPQRDTNLLAHRLLARFGSLSGVLDAGYDNLLKVKGITPNAALFLSQTATLTAMYKADKIKRSTEGPMSPSRAAEYANDLIGYRPFEHAVALLLDAKGTLLHAMVLESDARDHVSLDMAALAKEAIRTRATNAIVAHNHPSGDVTPSEADTATCETIRQALATLHITLLDCLIVANGNAYSMMHRPLSAANGADPEAAVGGELTAGEPINGEYDLLFNRNKRNDEH